MAADAGNDSSAILRRERLGHCNSTTESTDAARLALALQGWRAISRRADIRQGPGPYRI